MTRPIPDNERFLSRWSRLKRVQAGSADAASVVPPVQPPAAAQPPAIAPAGPAAGEGGAPSLPAIESLTMESDYAQFFQAKVPESLRRAAVKKLFADPHFNIMDGLDTYIDDYSKPDPIPPEMLARLVQARDIIDHPSNRKPENVDQAQAAAVVESGETAAVEQSNEQRALEQRDVVAIERTDAGAIERTDAGAIERTDLVAAVQPDDISARQSETQIATRDRPAAALEDVHSPEATAKPRGKSEIHDA